jgi:hypothetical protein
MIYGIDVGNALDKMGRLDLEERYFPHRQVYYMEKSFQYLDIYSLGCDILSLKDGVEGEIPVSFPGNIILLAHY